MKTPDWSQVEEAIISEGLVTNRTHDQLAKFIVNLDKMVTDPDFTEQLVNRLMKGYKEDCG